MLATNAGDGVVRTLALFLGPGARRCGAVGGSTALGAGPILEFPARAPWALRLIQSPRPSVLSCREFPNFPVKRRGLPSSYGIAVISRGLFSRRMVSVGIG